MPNRWISKRAYEGNPIGGTKGMSMTAKGPLRKIVRVIHSAMSLFERDWVELECGHEGPSTGQYKARCRECREMEKEKVS